MRCMTVGSRSIHSIEHTTPRQTINLQKATTAHLLGQLRSATNKPQPQPCISKHPPHPAHPTRPHTHSCIKAAATYM
jgi:hypothetical protein